MKADWNFHFPNMMFQIFLQRNCHTSVENYRRLHKAHQYRCRPDRNKLFEQYPAYCFEQSNMLLRQQKEQLKQPK